MDKSEYKEFIIDQEDYELLADAAKGKRLSEWKKDGVIVPGTSERIAMAWESIGNKHGFDWKTVMPITYNKLLAKDINNG